MNTYEIARDDEVTIRRTWYTVEANTEDEALDIVRYNSDYDESEETDWCEGEPRIENVEYGVNSYSVNARIDVEASAALFANEALKKFLDSIIGYTDNRGENLFEVVGASTGDLLKDEGE